MDFENQPMTEKEFFKMERKKKTKNYKLYQVGSIFVFGACLARVFIYVSEYIGFDLSKNVYLTFSSLFLLIEAVGCVLFSVGLIKIRKAYEKYLENYIPEHQEE